jgi:hypothetical protein
VLPFAATLFVGALVFINSLILFVVHTDEFETVACVIYMVFPSSAKYQAIMT